MAIIISVDSDDEEAAVRGALADTGLSFAIRHGRVYQDGGSVVASAERIRDSLAKLAELDRPD